ncbi:MAG: peptide chain release factor N(5)-glutamine methyltransferase [Elusimicrobia bacterium]|nr:peptide chain release factor N(5)-glutamine methyltransferase [Elusimicrobiota bacterium]
MIATVEVLDLTVAQAVAEGAHRLAKAGISNAEGEAKELVSRVLGISRKSLDFRRTERWGEASRKFLDALILQRLAHVPLAYLLGEWDFLDMTLTVTPDVLIPRPETEELFEWMVRDTALSGAVPLTWVDVGTGAGGLALAMARSWPNSRGTAIDLSAAALAVAGWNAQRHGVEKTISFRRADLLEGIRDCSVDLMVANLPYVRTSDMAGLSPEVLKEPRRALEGGPDGLTLIRRLIPLAFQALGPGGRLFLEVGEGQADDVAKAMAAAGFLDVSVKTDVAAIRRCVKGGR